MKASNFRTFTHRLWIVMGALSIALVLATTTVSAEGEGEGAESPGAIRVVHGAASFGPLDVCVNGVLVSEPGGLPFATVGAYEEQPVGFYTYAFYAAGEGCDGTELGSTTIFLGLETRWTFALGDSLAKGLPTLQVFNQQDDLTPTPGVAKLSLYNLSPDAADVDVTDAPDIEVSDALFDSILYGGPFSLSDLQPSLLTPVVRDATNNTLLATGDTIELGAGGIYTLFLFGRRLGEPPLSLSGTTDVQGDPVPLEGEGGTEGEGTIEGEGANEGSIDGEGALDGEGTVDGEGGLEGEGSVDGEGASDGEGSIDGEGSLEGEGSIEGEGTIEGEGVLDGEGNAEGEGASDGEGSVEGQVDGEGNIEGEGSIDGEGSLEGEGEGEFVDPLTDVIYVRVAATGGDGLSWETALGSIQAGVDLADALGRPEVWVGRGVYVEGGDADGELRLQPLVALYGGFRGDETARTQRDFIRNVCIIDGSASNAGEPADHVVVGAEGARLDGFTVRGGAGDGGGLLVQGVAMSVWNCIFRDNVGGRFGAGALALNSATLTVIDSVFRDNSSELNGGGLSASNASVFLQGVLFYRNTTGGSGGGAYFGTSASVSMGSCRFTENLATNGGGLATSGALELTLNGCWIGQNAATQIGGGAQLVNTANATLMNSVFSLNDSTVHGGGLNNQTSSPLISQCTFSGNTAVNRGATLYNQLASSPVIVNTIFANNTGELIGNLDSSQPVISYSLAEGTLLPGDSNVSGDARFVDEANEVYGLRSTSPAVDTGLDTSASEFGGVTGDFVGNPRGADGDGFGAITGDGSEYDMGAFEAPFNGAVGDSREVPKPEHSGDVNEDFVFDLTELLRIIQLYNAGGYGCALETEDGYEPNGDNALCDPHSTDFADGDFVITLSELLRSLQLFNLGGYYLCPGVTEDNFCGLDQ